MADRGRPEVPHQGITRALRRGVRYGRRARAVLGSGQARHGSRVPGDGQDRRAARSRRLPARRPSGFGRLDVRRALSWQGKPPSARHGEGLERDFGFDVGAMPFGTGRSPRSST